MSPTFRVGGPTFSRELSLDKTSIRTAALVLEGERMGVEARELELVFDASRWRYDVPWWRWYRGSGGSAPAGFEQPEFDDSAWSHVPHLHPIYDPAFDGLAWFRHEFDLPEGLDGETITIGVGGMDDEDWRRYAVFLNGVRLDEWQGTGRWREPRLIAIPPDDERRGTLVFGGCNLLAVEAEGLERRIPELRRAEREHYLFQGWLLDQFVAAGPVYRVDGDFEITAVRPQQSDPLSALEIEAFSRERPEVAVTISYLGGDGPHVRKRVAVRNAGVEPLRLLEARLEALGGGFAAEGGGRGQPLLAERIFCGVEHPAGVNQGGDGWLRATQLPGVDIAPGGTFESESVVIGAAALGESVVASFRSYIRNLRPRHAAKPSIYSALGWYDFTNPADPLPELTEELVDENLRLLESLREQGVAFDVYMIDDWWEPTDLTHFRKRTFPSGGPATAARIGEAGLAPGLWSATTRAVWTSGEAPGIEAAVAGGIAASEGAPPVANESGQWSWDEEFAALFTKERRLCLAAEPYRSTFRRALPDHVRQLGLACLKLDCATLHCTSSDHDHLPGKYSVEPIMNAVIETARDAQAENPGLLVIWYWGFRSPWWLAHGDLLFDKGLKLEAASPASTAAPSLRQSISLNVDQAVHHAELIPLECQDSLGVWLGNVAWANRLGKEEWRDAFLLDLARGSAIVQLWGNLELLDVGDVEFVARVQRWRRDRPALSGLTMPVGGDPWLAEPYGYFEQLDEGAVLTLFNPTFFECQVELDLPGEFVPVEVYPCPGIAADLARSPAVSIELRPFEVRCLELLPPAALAADIPTNDRPVARPTRAVDVSSLHAEIESGTDGAAVHLVRGSVRLPQVERNNEVALVVRLHRDGIWWYHPEPQALLELRASLKGIDVYSEVVPTVRARNGPGAPWVLYKLPSGSAWSGEELTIRLRAELPVGVSLLLEAQVWEPWWLRHERRFEAPARVPAGGV